MAQALFDEEQVQIGAPVEHRTARQRPRSRRDVLIADVGRIADDRGEKFVFRQLEKIHRLGARRRVYGIIFYEREDDRMPRSIGL
jgi:hypothetical protein